MRGRLEAPSHCHGRNSLQKNLHNPEQTPGWGQSDTILKQSDLASENFNKKTVIGTLQHLLNTYYALRALHISHL